MGFLSSLFSTFFLTILLKLTFQQTTVCDISNRPTACGYDYVPVCAFPTGCNDYTCTYTERNACTACKDAAVGYYINGACPQDALGSDTSDSDTTDTGNSDSDTTGTETDPGNAGTEPSTGTNTTNTTTTDGTNSTTNSTTNGTDISTNSTTNSTDPSDSSGSNTSDGSGVGNSTNSTIDNSTNTTTDNGSGSTTPSTICADYGAMIKASGKIVLGALCCGDEPTICPRSSKKVCGVLTNCVGDVCRKTYQNYCMACNDNSTAVELYLNAPCESLFLS